MPLTIEELVRNFPDKWLECRGAVGVFKGQIEAAMERSAIPNGSTDEETGLPWLRKVVKRRLPAGEALSALPTNARGLLLKLVSWYVDSGIPDFCPKELPEGVQDGELFDWGLESSYLDGLRIPMYDFISNVEELNVSHRILEIDEVEEEELSSEELSVHVDALVAGTQADIATMKRDFELAQARLDTTGEGGASGWTLEDKEGYVQVEGSNRKIAAKLFEPPYGWYTKEFAYVPDDTPEGGRRQMLPPVAKSWVGTTGVLRVLKSMTDQGPVSLEALQWAEGLSLAADKDQYTDLATKGCGLKPREGPEANEDIFIEFKVVGFCPKTLYKNNVGEPTSEILPRITLLCVFGGMKPALGFSITGVAWMEAVSASNLEDFKELAQDPGVKLIRLAYESRIDLEAEGIEEKLAMPQVRSVTGQLLETVALQELEEEPQKFELKDADKYNLALLLDCSREELDAKDPTKLQAVFATECSASMRNMALQGKRGHQRKDRPLPEVDRKALAADWDPVKGVEIPSVTPTPTRLQSALKIGMPRVDLVPSAYDHWFCVGRCNQVPIMVAMGEEKQQPGRTRFTEKVINVIRPLPTGQVVCQTCLAISATSKGGAYAHPPFNAQVRCPRETCGRLFATSPDCLTPGCPHCHLPFGVTGTTESASRAEMKEPSSEELFRREHEMRYALQRSKGGRSALNLLGLSDDTLSEALGHWCRLANQSQLLDTLLGGGLRVKITATLIAVMLTGRFSDDNAHNHIWLGKAFKVNYAEDMGASSAQAKEVLEEDVKKAMKRGYVDADLKKQYQEGRFNSDTPDLLTEDLLACDDRLRHTYAKFMGENYEVYRSVASDVIRKEVYGLENAFIYSHPANVQAFLMANWKGLDERLRSVCESPLNTLLPSHERFEMGGVLPLPYLSSSQVLYLKAKIESVGLQDASRRHALCEEAKGAAKIFIKGNEVDAKTKRKAVEKEEEKLQALKAEYHKKGKAEGKAEERKAAQLRKKQELEKAGKRVLPSPRGKQGDGATIWEKPLAEEEEESQAADQ